ncbi:gibberellin-regulated protein 14-like [Alnus glutinosa]|uniref:gibberellin-regulated protein 14-like n=1 Tax=Alnus glutinosa TaxID=3517 RepID=UPI002D797A75|nr:gibberellin-regulated protein 14-like [Alnus glutinosa]
MAFKAMLFLLTTFLVVTTRVSSNDQELNTKAIDVKVPPPAQAPAKVPVKAPSLTPPPKAPAYAPPPKAPAPEPPVKPPAPAPPVNPPAPAPLPPVTSKKDCIPQCDRRCQLHSRKRVCMRACMTCCDRCKCVPPGTFGNREMCGKCYTEMTTHGNKYKCP